MYWLDNNTGIPTAPTIPAVISATKRFFTNGGSGTPPSVPEDFWFNMITDELLAVLTMAGITPAKNDLGQIAKAIQSIAFSAYPVGAPIPWPTAIPPAGFLAMTGQSFSGSTYPKLAAAYPSLALPDMRAEFIRGWDNARGVDVGRSLLTAQKGSVVSIDQNISDTASTGAIGATSQSAAGLDTLSGTDLSGLNVAAFATSSPSVSSPSNSNSGVIRPRNISFYYIVRAA